MRKRRVGKYGLAQRVRLSIAAAEAFISTPVFVGALFWWRQAIGVSSSLP